MSAESVLMLDVDHIEPLGSEGQPDFGSPQDLEVHRDLLSWTLALRKPGGEGCASNAYAYIQMLTILCCRNILKLRKQTNAPPPPVTPAKTHTGPSVSNALTHTTVDARGKADIDAYGSALDSTTKAEEPWEEYRRVWRVGAVHRVPSKLPDG